MRVRHSKSSRQWSCLLTKIAAGGRRAGNLGSGDYARITDFHSGEDKLQLRKRYYFTTVNKAVTSIYWGRNANNRFDTTGDFQESCHSLAAIQAA